MNEKLIVDLKAFKMQHSRSGNEDALFWPGSAPGSHRVDYDRVWDLASFRRNYFRPALIRPALIRAELPAIRVHDLRHSAASLWLDAGIDDRYVSRWLGHANRNTTDMIYSHMYATDYGKHVARFEAYSAAEG